MDINRDCLLGKTASNKIQEGERNNKRLPTLKRAARRSGVNNNNTPGVWFVDRFSALQISATKHLMKNAENRCCDPFKTTDIIGHQPSPCCEFYARRTQPEAETGDAKKNKSNITYDTLNAHNYFEF